MNELLSKLADSDKLFICGFANTFITQIPYIDMLTISGLNKDYLIKQLKRNKSKLSEANQKIAEKIIQIN
jgi:hypothetical protein